MSVTALADRLDIHKGTCHAILSAMTKAGLVSRDSVTLKYSLGSALIELGAAATERFACAAPATHQMHQLHARTGATVMVVALVGDDFVNVASISGGPDAEVGRLRPCVAPMGLVYRAFAARSEREAWLGGITPPAVAAYARQAMAAARRRGYVVGMARVPYQRIGDCLDQLRGSTDGTERLRLTKHVTDLLRVGYYPVSADEPDPAVDRVQFVTAPVRCPHGGHCKLAITIFDVPPELSAGELRRWSQELVAATQRAGAAGHLGVALR
jgi:hypothetical protein